MKNFETRLARLEQRKAVNSSDRLTTILRTLIAGDGHNGWFEVLPDEITERGGRVWQRDQDEPHDAFLERVQTDIEGTLPPDAVTGIHITAGSPGEPADCPVNESLIQRGIELTPPALCALFDDTAIGLSHEDAGAL